MVVRVAAALLLACVFAGCTSDDSPKIPSAVPPSHDVPPPRGPATWLRDIEDDAFPAGVLTVQLGDVVAWTNRGDHPHSVTADDESFDSDETCPSIIAFCLMSDGRYAHTFVEPGSYGYHCKVHANMRGTVTVLARYDPAPQPL